MRTSIQNKVGTIFSEWQGRKVPGGLKYKQFQQESEGPKRDVFKRNIGADRLPDAIDHRENCSERLLEGVRRVPEGNYCKEY